MSNRPSSSRSQRAVRAFRFGEFELDLRAAELHRNGVKIRLQEQPFRILTILLEHPGEVVLREDIRKKLWPNDTVVEVSHGINAAVQRLREALGETAEQPRFIETLARRGYRFLGAVEVTFNNAADAHATGDSGVGPRAAQNPTVQKGREISHFEVKEKLGGGGMGVVYRAEDLKLGRSVALKFLPPDLASDPVALGRFRMEARAASALNHPNICTIYGVEECDGQPVIVMELLEGETLQAILAKGPLPLDKALATAIQIAGALDAAHRKGIVHRDLKPGNVLITRTGPKILDFGLAKMERPVALSPEMALPVTQQGAILGTLNYMSPEQAQGKDAGPCSDIFAFGSLLYEMLTGQRAFDGPNAATVMAAILASEPPAAPHAIPATLGRLLNRCLNKDPDERWQSARDLKAALEWIGTGAAPLQVESATFNAPTTFAVRPRHIVAAVAAVLLAAGAIYGFRNLNWRMAFSTTQRPRQLSVARPPENVAPRQMGPREAALEIPAGLDASQPANTAPPREIVHLPQSVRMSIDSPAGVLRLSLSPDGHRIAYTSGGRLYVRTLSSKATVVLDAEGAGTPFWSQDSRSLAMANGKTLQKIDLHGGPPTILCDINTSLAGAWAPDGTILIGRKGDGIYRVPAGGGAASRITELDRAQGETRHLAPFFLPDGRHFLYVAGSATSGKSMLYAASLGASGRKALIRVDSNVAFVLQQKNTSSGYLLFAQGESLLARAFDAATLTVSGNNLVIAERIASTPAEGARVVLSDFTGSGPVLAYRTNPAFRQILQGPASPVNRTGGITVLLNWMAKLAS